MNAYQFWHALWLVVVVSLVYSGTRYEALSLILCNAARTALWIIGFMVIMMLVLGLISW